MTINKNQLIERLIGNLSNSIVHSILEISNIQYKDKYRKESLESFEIAKSYRRKINPIDKLLRVKDSVEIKDKIINKVKSELLRRISLGYTNIDLSLIEDFVDRYLSELRID